MDSAITLRTLWQQINAPDECLKQLCLTGADPVLPSSFPLGGMAQACIAASALMAARLHSDAGGPKQAIAVDMQHAATEFHSERWLRINGEEPPPIWDELAGVYPCADGFVRLHTNFPQHRDGVLRLLCCEPKREAIASALLSWKSIAFEEACAKAEIVGSAYRQLNDWLAHPHAALVSTWPLISIEKFADGTALDLDLGPRPLSGMRVLDLTRVIAGPVCTRTLAAYGAEVLTISSPHLPWTDAIGMDTSRGKRSAFLHLRHADELDQLKALVNDCHVFVQGYRPGALAGLKLSEEEIVRIRPGIIHASINAYGSCGPWGGRRGFDSLVQTATGINAMEAEAFGEKLPRALPVQALDHASGYLLALGVMEARRRQRREGGSWRIEVSLVRTAHWLRSLGRVATGPKHPTPNFESIAPWMKECESGFGRISYVEHAAIFEKTPAYWALPPVAPGSHPAIWLGR